MAAFLFSLLDGQITRIDRLGCYLIQIVIILSVAG